jgi:hypothetical protein
MALLARGSLRCESDYFLKPAAMSTRVIAAPTLIAWRRGILGGAGGGLSVAVGRSVASGVGAGTCSGIGDTVGINLALGESSAAGLRLVLALFCRIHPVRPKNSAM